MRSFEKEPRAEGPICRFRDLPRPVHLTLLSIPVAVTVGTLGLSSASFASAAPTGAAFGTAAVSTSTTPPVLHPRTVARLNAYFGAGYDYDDAVLLSRFWSEGTTVFQAKSRAGALLRQQDTLPIRPNQDAWHVSKDTALAAYVNNGYGYHDARKLAQVWTGTRYLSDVKARAGRKLLAGQRLPAVGARPSAPTRLATYFHAHYDYDDAVVLARFWGNDTTPYQAKVRAGGRLLRHVAVPIKPDQDPWKVDSSTAIDAYFNNGYRYDDAVALAKVWTGVKDLGEIKANAGRKLMAGLPLPLGA